MYPPMICVFNHYAPCFGHLPYNEGTFINRRHADGRAVRLGGARMLKQSGNAVDLQEMGWGCPGARHALQLWRVLDFHVVADTLLASRNPGQIFGWVLRKNRSSIFSQKRGVSGTRWQNQSSRRRRDEARRRRMVVAWSSRRRRDGARSRHGGGAVPKQGRVRVPLCYGLP